MLTQLQYGQDVKTHGRGCGFLAHNTCLSLSHPQRQSADETQRQSVGHWSATRQIVSVYTVMICVRWQWTMINDSRRLIIRSAIWQIVCVYTVMICVRLAVDDDQRQSVDDSLRVRLMETTKDIIIAMFRT